MLKADGCDVLTTVDAGRANKRLSDEDQLTFAAEQHRAIFSHNLSDYFALGTKWASEGKHHHGIVVSDRRYAWQLYLGFLKLFERYPDGIPDTTLRLP